MWASTPCRRAPHFAPGQPEAAVSSCGEPTGFDSGEPLLAQVDREHGHRPDREEFGLPVLERALPEVRACHVLEPADRLLAVLASLGVFRAPVVQRLPAPREQEDRGHREDEGVLVPKRPAPSSAWRGPAHRRARSRRPSARDLIRARCPRAASTRSTPSARAKRREDEERELEELRLPVLEHGAPEVGREHVVEPGQRSPVVRELVGDARCPANDCPTSAATKIAPKKSDSPFSTAKRFNRPPARPRSRARAPRGSAATRPRTSSARSSRSRPCPKGTAGNTVGRCDRGI